MKYFKAGKQNKIPKWAQYVIAALVLLGIWVILTIAVNNSLLLPSPVQTLQALISLAGEAEFWQSIGMSFLRVILGFVLGCIAGVVLATAGYYVNLLDCVIRPTMTLLKSVPVASFIMLVILLFKRDVLPVFVCFVMVTPIVWSGVSLALDSLPEQYLELVHAYKLPRGKRITRLYIPWVMPYLAEACVTALGFAWKSGIAAEVLCQPSLAIGTGIYESKIYLEPASLFAWTATVVIFSLILEKLLKASLSRIRDRREYGNKKTDG